MMPEKRYEYRFNDIVFSDKIGISKSVQWRDSMHMMWMMKAFYVYDHLRKEVIKQR